jgi:hypothetical protein
MGEKQPGTTSNFYHLVSAFLRDFWTESEKGYRRHKKGVWLFLSFVFLCFVVIGVAAYKISETPWFCGVCHNMTVYVDSWKASSHRKVGCIECHYKPGLVNHFKGKWKDGQLSLVYFITGKSPTKAHAEIDDSSCLQSGCHRKESLKQDLVFKNVVFNHSQHIEQMKRQKQLRCTTCHSQIVQGAHMLVTEVECFICHFYKSKDQKEYVTGCGSCHFEARGDIKVSAAFTFNHKLYIERGVKCEQCHTNVVQGDGHVQELACVQCHSRRELLDASKYTPESLHKNHVTGHKVECFTCHSAIKHKMLGLHYTGQEPTSCSECHQTALHSDKVNMYLGKGARGVKDRPNRMALINMDCDVCHGKVVRSKVKESCRACHGTLSDGMIEQWKKLLKQAEDDLQKQIAAARASAQGKTEPALRKKLEDAQFNYDFLVKGSGHHNIVYAMEIVEASKQMLQGSPGKEKAKASPTDSKASCVKLCHGDIADRKVPFGNVVFLHSMHEAEKDDSCLKCHTPYSAEHGKTTPKDCSKCHHGEGMGKVSCQDCHRAEERMFKGAGVNGVKEIKDWMRGKVTCQQCHTSVKQGKKESAASIKTACAACHGKKYLTLVDDWIAQNKNVPMQFRDKLSAIEKKMDAIETKDKSHSVPMRGVLDEINQDMHFVFDGNWAHNPQYAEAIVAKISKNIQTLEGMIKAKEAGQPIIIQTKQNTDTKAQPQKK